MLEKLKNEMHSFLFLTRGNRFIDNGFEARKSASDAKDFLKKFLICECVSGVMSCTDADLISICEKITELIERGEKIFSEDLPLHPEKKHEDKNLRNVFYWIDNSIVRYEKVSK